MFFSKKNNGITLIETIISIAILGIVMLGVFQGFSLLFDIFFISEVQLASSTLANEQLEIIRNIPYSTIGTIGGVPVGVVEPVIQKQKNGILFNATTTIRNIDDPFDGVFGGVPHDAFPADYKLVEIILQCVLCEDTSIFTFTGRVAPKGLETATDNGALFVQVIDASGLPVSGATVQITNTTLVPEIAISDITDGDGYLKIIDTSPASESYHIEVSKSGYSSDATYPPSGGNPNPTKRDATVVAQNITHITFTIDKVSTIQASSVTTICAPISNFDFDITGVNLIGTSPDVPKFSASYVTDANGLLTITNIEGDTYTTNFTDTAYDIQGTIPTSPFVLLPDSTQAFRIVTTTKNPSALMVTVVDEITGLPLSDASVTLTGSGVNETLITGRGFLSQGDWSGGSGQIDFTTLNEYFLQDGNLDTTTNPGDSTLQDTGGETYASSGWIESSTFDTGSASTFFDISVSPTSQPPDVGADSLRIQFASATTSSPLAWDFLGPDGTSGSYYTSMLTSIHSLHANDQYFRYKAYLQTASTTFTPALSDIAFTFASQCVPPGQVLFSGLSTGGYTVVVTRAGYQDNNAMPQVFDPWQEVIVEMIPE